MLGWFLRRMCSRAGSGYCLPQNVRLVLEGAGLELRGAGWPAEPRSVVMGEAGCTEHLKIAVGIRRSENGLGYVQPRAYLLGEVEDIINDQMKAARGGGSAGFILRHIVVPSLFL